MAQGCSIATDLHHNLFFKQHRFTTIKSEKDHQDDVSSESGNAKFCAHTLYFGVCTLWACISVIAKLERALE